MRYPTQASVSKRLHQEMLAALDKIQSKRIREQGRIWAKTRRRLQDVIYAGYRYAAPRGRWNLQLLQHSGVMGQVRMGLRSILTQYHAESTAALRAGFKEIRRQSILRHAWILDNLTPDNIKIKIPSTIRLHEALRIGTYADWETRWSLWNDSYQQSLIQNLTMGAMNESPVEDAQDEVDATKAGTPAFTLSDALSRIFNYEMIRQTSEGEDDVAEENGDFLLEEIWKTRGDATVCDDCDENEGMTKDDAYGYIPLHPNCNCYWELVPASYAALLRDGGPEAMDLANELRRRDLAPNTLLIRDENGDIAARVIVDFEKWTDGQRMSISGGQ